MDVLKSLVPLLDVSASAQEIASAGTHALPHHCAIPAALPRVVVVPSGFVDEASKLLGLHRDSPTVTAALLNCLEALCISCAETSTTLLPPSICKPIVAVGVSEAAQR